MMHHMKGQRQVAQARHHAIVRHFGSNSILLHVPGAAAMISSWRIWGCRK